MENSSRIANERASLLPLAWGTHNCRSGAASFCSTGLAGRVSAVRAICAHRADQRREVVATRAVLTDLPPGLVVTLVDT